MSISSPSSAIGIDFGGTTIKMAVVTEGRVVERGATIETGHHESVTSFLDAIAAVITILQRNHPTVSAVGVGLPGIVDSKNGIVHHLTNVKGWDEIPLKAELEKRTGLFAIIENDANSMTYGEWKFGAGKGRPNIMCMTLGTGVGAGLILNGTLYRGSQLAAGEVGHMSIDWKGEPDPYGSSGGLERYVGNKQIAERAQKLYAASGKNLSLDECSPEKLTSAALSGDTIAAQIWEETGAMIGACLASVQWLLNLDRIVIGGGVAKAGAILFEPIRKTIADRTINVIHNQLEIMEAALGTDAGIIGNAELALDQNP